MIQISEYDIIQNSALGALSLGVFCKAFFDEQNKEHGPMLPLTMPVLPIVFNEKSVALIRRRNISGGLFATLADDKSIFVGLQQRMEAMYEQTMSAAGLAFASGLIGYDAETTELIPVKVTPQVYNEYSPILATSKRLGIWFAALGFEQICTLLNIRF